LLPLQTRGKKLGVLGIIGPEGTIFSPEQLTLFKSIADQLGVAIENAYLFEKTEQAAIAAERNRLARDLHDAVTQTLFSASMIADVLPKIWDRNPEEGHRRLEELRQLTRGALSEMRTMLVELRPAALEDTDLGDLIGHQVNALIARTRIPVTYTRTCTQNPPPEIKELFYRIVQEAFNNITKHADATTVQVSLDCQPNRAELVIQDDGLGFELAVAQTEGLGLGIMAERARAARANLQIHSQIGQGARLSLTWALKNAESRRREAKNG
jgi:signal transduction histidine kinase